MSILLSITEFLTSDLKSTIISLVIGYLVYTLTRFYYNVYTMPPSPFPWPFIGNLMYFFKTKEHFGLDMMQIPKRLGPLCTVWVGHEPMVMIADIDMARDVFRKNDIAGRPKELLLATEKVSNEQKSDVICADYGHRWEALRRVSHSAVQKYSVTDKLVYLCSDCVDHTIELIVQKEGFDRPFVPFDYIYNMFLNIVANSAFGQRYELDDPEYKLIKRFQKDFWKGQSWKMAVWFILPSTRNWFDRNTYKEYLRLFDEYLNLLKDKYQSHYKDYDESVVRDFCDTLIAAKNEALREGKESAPYLTDDNLSMALFDLFFAGTDTSQTIFRWLLLYLVYDKNIQKRLRQEIESEIGDRIPTHEGKDRCHYAMAFISEVLRFRNVVPQGVEHKTMVATKIGDYTIPKDTKVAVYQGHIMYHDEYWGDGEVFRPERFLENGQYMTTRPKPFIPFGVGRRVCLGEKLAIADLFLVLVRFLQKTSDYEIGFHSRSKDPLGVDKSNFIEFHPNSFEISFSKKCFNQ